MEVEHPNHRRPLYLMAIINSVQIRRALVDTRASLNLIALSTLEAVGLIGRRILGAPIETIGLRGVVESTEGYMQLALRVSPIVALTRFHMINSEVSYHILLGRPWLHKHCFIPSTYHQCVKGRLNGRPIRIPANPKDDGVVVSRTVTQTLNHIRGSLNLSFTYFKFLHLAKVTEDQSHMNT